MSRDDFLCAKIFIIDYYDTLVRQIDIYTEQILEQTNDHDLIVVKEKEHRLNVVNNAENDDAFVDPYSDKYEYNDEAKIIPISETTKVRDYVNEVRLRAIEEVKKSLSETLEYYEANKSRFNRIIETNEELEADLFANRFVFTLNLENMEEITDSAAVFKMVLIVADFFINHSDLDLLKYFLSYNDAKFNIELRKINYNSKTILVRLLANYLNGLLKTTGILGNEIIKIDKKTLLSINKLKLDREIISCFNIDDDLKVEFVNLKSLGISSSYRLDSSNLNLQSLINLEYLFLRNVTLNSNMFANMSKLRHLHLNNCYIQINDGGDFLKQPQLCASLETLNVNGLHRPVFTYQYETTRFFYLKPIHVAEDFRTAIKITNLARGIKMLKNLRCLRLVNFELEQPDLDFLDSLPTHLRTLDLDLYYSELNDLDRLFKGIRMPNLREFGFHSRYYDYLNTFIGVRVEWFSGFANLRKLDISRNDMESVDLNEFDFSNLESLDLSFNRIRSIGKIHNPIGLRNLARLDLSNNLIASIEPNAFQGLINLKVLDLRENSLESLIDVISNDENENNFSTVLFGLSNMANIKVYS